MRMPYRFKKDSWQPARLRRMDHVTLMAVLIFIGYLRGLDYTFGDDVWGSRDFMLAAAPEWVWGGVGFITGASILWFGTATRRHVVVYIGHCWLGISYALNALAAILATQPWFFDGIRGGGTVGLVALFHFIQAVRTGGAPLRVDAPPHHVSEHIVTGGDE